MRNDKNFSEYDPWNQETYRTGDTNPPKKHRGLIAVLLVLIILLFGVVSILSVINVRLFRQINHKATDASLPIFFSQAEASQTPENIPPSIPEDTDATPPQDPQITLESSPFSIENIPQQGGLSLQEIYENTIDSVVSISCTFQGGASTGTGVIVNENGYIVTNCHVVEGAQTIDVLLTDGRQLDAVLIGADAVSDLAVLQITAENLIPAQLGDSSSLRVGDSVVAIGDPLGSELRGTMTNGIISAINRDIDVGGRRMNLIQTNVALNSGNSGGPLINCYGQVIGINTMKMGDSMSAAGVEGLGFAIPSTTVQDIANQLITQGYVSGRPSLGISGEEISSIYQFYYRLPKGLLITEVAADSSAALAGIQAGDILVSLDGTVITSSDILQQFLYGHQPGDTLQAIIYRSGKQYAVTITVGEANR